MNKIKKNIRFSIILAFLFLNLIIIGNKAEATVSCAYHQYCVEGPISACRLLTASTSPTLNNNYVIGGKINARCTAIGGCQAGAYSWWNSGTWDNNTGIAPTSVGVPPTGCCTASDCAAQACKIASCSSYKCSYINSVDGTSCGVNKQCKSGICTDIITSYTICDANVPCAYTSADGKKCRKMNNGSWQWISATYACGENNFCETFECGTSTSSPRKGYCGFSNSGSFTWVDSTSASCPYSISVIRDKTNYQMTDACYYTGQYCEKVWAIITVNRTDSKASSAYWPAYYLNKSGNNPTAGSYGPYKMNSINSYAFVDMGDPSQCSYMYYDNIYGTNYLLVDKTECCTLGDPKYPDCIYGRAPTGIYTSTYSLGYLSSVNVFNVNCDFLSYGTEYSCLNPPLNATVCSGDNTGLTQNTNSALVSYCVNNTTKCEYACNPGYILSGGVCVIPETESICVECNEANKSNVCKEKTFESCSGKCEGTKECSSSWQEVLP